MIVLIILGYVITGAFFCGLVDDDNLSTWIFFWPIILIVAVLISAFNRVRDIGYNIRNLFNLYFKKEELE